MDQSKKKLVIHMDVNLTCIMQDKANNYSLEFTVPST